MEEGEKFSSLVLLDFLVSDFGERVDAVDSSLSAFSVVTSRVYAAGERGGVEVGRSSPLGDSDRRVSPKSEWGNDSWSGLVQSN